MTLDETIYKDEILSKIGIKRMLIVDDRIEHIEAAKEYFKDYKKVQIDYEFSAESAKEKIQSAYFSQQKYDFVLTDMQMEEKTSGQKVVAEAAKYQALGIVVTSRGAFSHGGIDFGEGTRMIGPGFDEEVLTPKSQPETWKKITEKSIEYFTRQESLIYAAQQRYAKYVGRPSDEIADLIMKSYRFE